jgi:hypothetical protein
VVSFEERFIRWFLFHDFGSVLPSVKRVFQAGGHGIRFSGATLAWSNPDTHPLYTLFPARAQRFSSVIQEFLITAPDGKTTERIPTTSIWASGQAVWYPLFGSNPYAGRIQIPGSSDLTNLFCGQRKE